MLGYMSTVAGQVATLFLLMGVGFFLGKRGKIDRVGIQQMTYLLLYVVTACVIIRSLQIENNPAILHALGITAAAVAALHVLFALICLLFFRRQDARTGPSLRFSVIYGNIGFMGLPLVEAVLGKEALLFAAVYLAVFSLFYWTHGIAIMGGRASATLKKAVLNPGVIAVLIGLPLFLCSITLPPVLAHSISFLADLNTPLAMVIIGFQMSCTSLTSTFRRPVLFLSSFLKLVVMPLVAALVLLPFHPDPVLYCVVVLLSATPTAGSVSMFAQQYDKDTETAAQSVTLSTVLSVLTLPLWAAIVQLIIARPGF